LRQLLQQEGVTVQEATAATVLVLKQIEAVLREVCLANGLSDGQGAIVVKKKGKNGQASPKKLHGFGSYLIECHALKAHLSKPLLNRLHQAKDTRNLFAHQPFMCDASMGLGYCQLGFELLQEVGPPVSGSSFSFTERAQVTALLDSFEIAHSDSAVAALLDAGIFTAVGLKVGNIINQ
jgi:hypothetical protein